MFGGQYEKTEMEFKPLPKGRYVCILDNCLIEQTSKGTNYLKMDFTVVNGQFANRKLWHKIWFTEKAYNMAAQQLDNIGVFGDIKQAETIDQFLTNAAEVVFKKVGAKMEVSVTGHDTYNDKEYEKTFLTGLGDAEAVQAKAASAAGVDASEELPF